LDRSAVRITKEELAGDERNFIHTCISFIDALGDSAIRAGWPDFWCATHFVRAISFSG